MTDPVFTRTGYVDATIATTDGLYWDYALHPDNTTLYVAASTDGLWTFDVTDKASPTFEGRKNTPQMTITGTHTGGNGVTTLVDSGLTAANYEWDYSPNQQWSPAGNSAIVKNTTAATQGVISGNTATTADTDITWNTGDAYEISYDRAFYLGQTDVLISEDGDTLFTCGRNVGNTDYPTDPPPATGLFVAYDISGANKQDPQWLSSYRPPSMNPIPIVEGFAGNEWYQGMVQKGDYIFLASQLNGLVVLDVSDPSNITRAAQYGLAELETNFPDHAADGLYWECSRIALVEYGNGEDWVFLANHGNGIMAIEVTTPTSPANAYWYDAATKDPYGTGATQLRTRNVVSDHVNGKQYIFEANNNNPNAVDSPARGLIIRDVTDPTDQATCDAYFYTPIAQADNDIWNDLGDKPILGIWKHLDWVYLANGQKGVAVFDVSDPENAVYLGLQGSLDTGVNLFQANIYGSGDDVYAFYGSGASSSAYEDRLYIDNVTGGPAMAFTIGNNNPTASTTQFLPSGRAASSGTDAASGKTYTAGADDYVDVLGFTYKESGATRGWICQLHEVNVGSEIPTTPVGPVIAHTSGIGSATVQHTQAITPFKLTENTTYCVVAGHDDPSTTEGNSNIGTDSLVGQTLKYDATLPNNGTFNSTFVVSGTTNDQDYAIFATGYTDDDPTAPTLTTPYSIGTNNGPLFVATSSDTVATVEGTGFLDGNAGWASLLKTGDVVMIQCSNATKMYTMTVVKETRTITLSTGLAIS